MILRIARHSSKGGSGWELKSRSVDVRTLEEMRKGALSPPMTRSWALMRSRLPSEWTMYRLENRIGSYSGLWYSWPSKMRVAGFVCVPAESTISQSPCSLRTMVSSGGSTDSQSQLSSSIMMSGVGGVCVLALDTCRQRSPHSL